MGRHRSTYNRQSHDEMCADADSAVYVDAATVLLPNDGTCDRQSLSRAAADFLRREEWIEDLLDVLLRDTAAVIRDGNYYAVAVAGRGDCDASRRGILAGLLDGMCSIHDEIEEYLVDLADVAHHLGHRPELRFDGGDVLVFVMCDDERRLDRVVQVGGTVFVR